jgi:hypothetical protein
MLTYTYFKWENPYNAQSKSSPFYSLESGYYTTLWHSLYQNTLDKQYGFLHGHLNDLLSTTA